MKLVLFLSLLISGSILFAQRPDHSKWDVLLKKYVTTNGKVNYKGFKSEVGKLDAYLADLKKNSPTSSWTTDESKSFWINAYNANTVRMILNHYPVASIMDIKYEKLSAFDYKWIEIGVEKLSLNDIENVKIRPVYKDPRIHFVLNCASESCPILYNHAITTTNIENVLTAQTKAFINDPTKNKITPSKIEISELFKWYSEDFGGVIPFLKKYSNTKIFNSASVSYLPYNWKLNE